MLRLFKLWMFERFRPAHESCWRGLKLRHVSITLLTLGQGGTLSCGTFSSAPDRTHRHFPAFHCPAEIKKLLLWAPERVRPVGKGARYLLKWRRKIPMFMLFLASSIVT